MGKLHRSAHSGGARGLGPFDVDRHGQAALVAPNTRFGRMFRRAPAGPDPGLLEALAGTMQERPQPALSATPLLDSPYARIPAGYITFGQFIAHDLSYDRSSLDDQAADPDGTKSFVSPRLDLDIVYAGPPSTLAEPPCDPVDGAKLKIETLTDTTTRLDLPRGPDGAAVIPDPRNDENLLISQLHLAFLKLHNKFVDQIREENQAAERTESDAEIFAKAKRRCQWHYQWMVVNDYLPTIVGDAIVKKILKRDENGKLAVTTTLYTPAEDETPWIPIEFAVAAFRFGHSMLGETYHLNDRATKVEVFGEQPGPNNLNGGRALPPGLVVRWREFFRFPGASHDTRNRARKINQQLPKALFALPPNLLPPDDPQRTPFSLAARDLQRGRQYGLPSGQSVARIMKCKVDSELPVLENAEIDLDDAQGWNGEAPLWFYILKESERRPRLGHSLGPVGAWIVAEVILKLLDRDPDSYLGCCPTFSPMLPPDPLGGQLGMGHLLAFAGTD